MSFSGVTEAFAPIKLARDKLEQDAIAHIRVDAMRLLKILIDITPVNTGQTVRNFLVSPSSSPGVKSALGQQPPEATNNLPLGAELNRGVNTAAAMNDTRNALGAMRKLVPMFITNDVDQWGLIESGEAPGFPWKNRGPGGHTGLAMAFLRSTGNWK